MGNCPPEGQGDGLLGSAKGTPAGVQISSSNTSTSIETSSYTDTALSIDATPTRHQHGHQHRQHVHAHPNLHAQHHQHRHPSLTHPRVHTDTYASAPIDTHTLEERAQQTRPYTSIEEITQIDTDEGGKAQTEEEGQEFQDIPGRSQRKAQGQGTRVKR